MNFLAHCVVAARLAGASPERTFGAAVPDLAGIAGVRYDREGLPPPTLAGVALHLAADSAFHADRRFLAGARTIRLELEARGVGRGPSRAVGHVGWELLLDGVLLGDPRTAAVFDGALATADTMEPAVRPGDRERWRTLVGSLRHRRWWTGYDDPRFIADRLHDMLERRRLLRLDREHVDVVAAVLTDRRPMVAGDAQDIVASVVRAITDGTPPR